MKPMSCGDVSLRDGKQAGKPCFRSEQVVATRVEAVVRKRKAYGQQFAFRIEEELEIHRPRQRARRVGERTQSGLQELRRLGQPLSVAVMFNHGLPKRVDPKDEISHTLVLDGGRDVMDPPGSLYR